MMAQLVSLQVQASKAALLTCSLLTWLSYLMLSLLLSARCEHDMQVCRFGTVPSMLHAYNPRMALSAEIHPSHAELGALF